LWCLSCPDTANAKTAETLINVRHNEIDSATYLTVSSVLGQKDRLTLPSQLQEERKTRLELMLPVNCEAQALQVERQAGGCTGDPELRYDSRESRCPLLAA
jgi:hypothetical protein